MNEENMPNGFTYAQLISLDEESLKEKMEFLLEELACSVTNKRAYILMIISLKRSISIHGD